MTKRKDMGQGAGDPPRAWVIPSAWVPIEEAARRLGLAIFEIAQFLAESPEAPRVALKLNRCEARRFPGLRPRLMKREAGDPVIADAPVDKARLSLSGFYLLQEPRMLAMCWPNTCSRADLFLWTDAYPCAAGPDDLLMPWYFGEVRLEDVYFHPDDLGEVSRGLGTQAKETLLALVGTLAQAAGHDIHASTSLMPVAERIAVQCKASGVTLSPRTIWNHLKAAALLVGPMKTPGGR